MRQQALSQGVLYCVAPTHDSAILDVSMMVRFGIPDVFFTVSPADDNSVFISVCGWSWCDIPKLIIIFGPFKTDSLSFIMLRVVSHSFFLIEKAHESTSILLEKQL